MRQIFLTGQHAGDRVMQILSVMNQSPVGYRLIPFSVGGEEKGRMLHLLTPPAPGMRNDIPALIETGGDPIVLPTVFDMLAGPALRQAQHARRPILLDGLPLLALAAPVFREAMMDCLDSDHLVITVALPGAEDALKSMGGDQIWFDLDAPNADMQFTLLQSEINLFFG